jgi:uncharacterized alkaline shock family protein YloU
MTGVESLDRPRGRTSVSSRALGRVASAVSATALGVDASSVGVDLTDDRGELVLTVQSPIRTVALDRVTGDVDVVARTGGSVLERASRAQGEIRTGVSELTGYRIARVVVRLKSADIRQEDRVR